MMVTMSFKFTSIEEVVSANLCSGCGGCTYTQPNKFVMTDEVKVGRRPQINSSFQTEPDEESLKVCPGISLRHSFDSGSDQYISELSEAWGPVLKIWEGHAADHDIRFAGSSGGVTTALALQAIETDEASFVLGTRSRSDKPYCNESFFGRTRADLIGATGSRYSPASPCDRLKEAEETKERFVFIGKPCDVAATHNIRKLHPNLDNQIAITIAFFCAGTPSTDGTISLLEDLGVEDLASLKTMRYRGNGWPGAAIASFDASDGTNKSVEMSYEDSWGKLSKHVQWRCRLCLDHTGEFADISVGDPWYREDMDGQAGSSLIIARTKKGKEFIENAIESGCLIVNSANPSLLLDSQPNLLRTRSNVWGRMLGSRLVGAKVPNYVNMPAFQLWFRNLGFLEKLRSVFGTVRRILARRLSA